MQKLHTKLTQKYPKYNNWHQTKHHNKIHWGVFVVFTLLVFGTISRWTPISLAADTVAPTTPTNLTASVVSSSQINLSWTASTDDVGVTGYKIYRCSGSTCTPTTQIATSATNSYSNTGLTASTAYTYAVSAYDAAGNESGKSGTASATTQASTGSTLPAWVPVTSPLANKEHPRLFFTAKDLPALRDKLKTQYKTELQDFINALDAGFNNDIVAKTQSARSYDAMNYAFLYLIDPGQMAPAFTFGHTRNEYGRKAIAHGLVIANDVLSGKIVDDMPQHLKPINMPMALVYDWTYTILTLQEKQKLTDAFIKSFSNRLVMPGLPLTSGGIYGLHQGPTGALAFWGDNIDDGVTGTYYRDWAQKLLDQLKIDWLDRVYPSLNYFYENSGWRESWSYDGYYFAHVIPFTSMLSSALGQDYLYNTGYIRYHPLFLLYGLKPRPDDKGKYYFIKYGTDDGTQSVSDSVYNRFIYPIDIIAKSDPDVAGLAKWILDQGYNGSLNSKTYDYLFNHFIFNNKNITPKPPSDLNLPIAQRFGSGQFIMRTGFQDPNSTNIQFWAPKFHFLPGGHPHYDFASFAIEKYGRLALDAGAGKSAPFVEGLKTHLLYSNKESMFHNTIAVYKPGEKDLYGFNYMDYHTRGLSESANKPTDPAYQDGGSNQVGELKAEELNTGNHNYINYNYSRAWDNTKVSYANREFIYLNPIPSSSKEFVIVFDRVISVDPSYTKRWFLWTAFEPEANGTFTQEKAGKWVSTNSDTVKVTNNYKGGLDTYLGSHGRLFSKTLLPTSFKINKLGGPGHEFEDAEGKSLVQTSGTMTNGACDWIGCWHIEVESTTNQKDDLFLHVMEIGDSNTLATMTPTQRIESSTGNMVGALIHDPNAPRILMFSRADSLQTTVTYTTTYTGTGKHLITNLEPATYNIYKDGVKLLSKAVPTGGPKTLYFEADGGGTFSITPGGPPPADTTAPSTPTTLTAATISSSQINLSWTASTDNIGVTGYKIYRCAGSACAPTVQIATSATNSYSNTGLTASTAYTYAVSAYDAAGNESGKSASINATTLSQFKPSDLNQDRKVDQLDFDILKQDWNRTDKPVSDLNQDGVVDSRDLGIMMGEWTS